MNIVEAYNAIKSGERVVNVDGELLSIDDSHQLCVERTGKIVPFSAWAMKDNSFWPASEKNCECCDERPPRYGDRFCSDTCARAFKLLQKQQEFLDSLKDLPDEERFKAMQKATATDGIFRPYIDPLLPGQEQVIGYKQDRIDPDFLVDTSDDDWRSDNHILELLIYKIRKRFQHYQELLEKADEENVNLRDRYEGALERIKRYVLDSLSGRTDGKETVEWHREGLNEICGIASVALGDFTGKAEGMRGQESLNKGNLNG